MRDPDSGSRLREVTISPNATINEAIALLDKAGTGALLLCEGGCELRGLLTDGDIRRAILRGLSLDTPCGQVASPNPVLGQVGLSQADLLRLMNTNDINHLPIVDPDGRLVDFLLRKDLVTEEQLELSAVIMAGGFGKRLRPLTDDVPKPMLPVGDRPLLELTIGQLRRAGIRRVNVTTHYLADSIINHFGDGRSFGVELNYVTEDHPLGTAGGLRLLKEPEGPLLVINGDILTGVPFKKILEYHREHRADATIGVRRYEVEVPYGVVECDGPTVSVLREKPRISFLINAGMYLLEPSVYHHIPEGVRFDMTDLIQCLLDARRPVVSFPIMEYWLDVGQPRDYEQAQHDVINGKV